MDCGYTRLQRLSAPYDWLSLVKKVWNQLGEYALMNMGVHNIKQPFIKADVIQPKITFTI